MSLESEIKNLTVAVVALTEALVAERSGPIEVNTPFERVPATATDNGVKLKAVEQKAVVEVAADNTVTITPTTATLEDCKAALRTLTQRFEDKNEANRAGMAALAKFGAKKLSDLKPEDYAAFVAECG